MRSYCTVDYVCASTRCQRAVIYVAVPQLRPMAHSTEKGRNCDFILVHLRKRTSHWNVECRCIVIRGSIRMHNIVSLQLIYHFIANAHAKPYTRRWWRDVFRWRVSEFENKSFSFRFGAHTANFFFPSPYLAPSHSEWRAFLYFFSTLFIFVFLLLLYFFYLRQENFDENFATCWRNVGADSDALRIGRFFLTHQSRVWITSVQTLAAIITWQVCETSIAIAKDM